MGQPETNSAAQNAAEKRDGDEPAHVEVTDELEPELLALIQTPPLEGLTTAEHEERLLKFGRNGMFQILR